jgi:RES domain-containing protein
MRAWRICSERFAESAFNGEGAYENGGRWNPPGFYVVYTSESLSLAALEFFVNLETRAAGMPLVAISVEIPESVKLLTIRADDLPAEWRAHPAPLSVQQIGSGWVLGGDSAVLSVPSVVIPSERNYLLNPTHPQFQKLVIHKPEPFLFDARMWKPGQ